MAAVSAPHTEYFLVVNAMTGIPQHFSVNMHRKEALGEFMDASCEKLSYLPAGVYDRETALYLIGQSAISTFIDADNMIKDGEPVHNGDTMPRGYLLIPVSGVCLPIHSSSIVEK